MSSKLYRKGSYKLIPLSDFNGLFELYFSVSLPYILSNTIESKKERAMYCYCLRRFVGLGLCEIANVFGFPNHTGVYLLERYFVSLTNVYSVVYCLEYDLQYNNFRRFIDSFRPRSSNADRQRNWRIRQRNKKKRK